jgi:hypothetical protein
VLHPSVTIDTEFERFTSVLETILGHFPEGVQKDIIERPQLAEQRLKTAEGAQQLMIFICVRSRRSAQHARGAKTCQAVPDWEPFDGDSDESA